MSIFIQEVLGLLKRNQKKIILDKNKDWFEFGKLYQSSVLNTGASYNPKMDPFVIKWGDIVCQVTEDMTRTLPGQGNLGYIPVYTDPSGFCSWDTLKDSIITQNVLNNTINIAGALVVNDDVTISGCDLTSTCNTFNLLNQPTTINFGSGASSIFIGRADPTSTVTMTGTTQSVSCTSGALVVNGGVGIAKNLNVCGNLVVSGTAKLDGTTQDDTQNKVLVIDGNNIVRWRAASTIGGGGGTTTASNGLTMSSATNVILGGALGQNTTITSSGFSLTAANNTAVTAFAGQNLGSGNGIDGSSVSGVGGNFITSSGTGVQATGGSSGLAANFGNFNSSTNTVIPILRIARGTTGTPANGIGGSIELYNITSASVGKLSNELISKWTNVTDATRTSQFIITGVNSGVEENKLIISGDGALELPDYGAGTKTGDATYALGVSSSGKVVEIVTPKVFVAIISQTGIEQPSMTIIYDSFGGTVTWTWFYVEPGVYRLVASQPIFDITKTAYYIITEALNYPGGSAKPYVAMIKRFSNTQVYINTWDIGGSGGYNNNFLSGATLKIEFY
jgi:hypothetical protein